MSEAEYEAVIGLEVHAELKTETKLFCSCPVSFGAAPNTHCCPVCLGHPGALPTVNREALRKTIFAGLALHCTVDPVYRADRKQYFYPDLPKAYQISQGDFPLCRNGYLEIDGDFGHRRISIVRMHLEEDAGKLMHQGNATLADFNRCGVPLIEIVSAPELRSGAEAAAYLRALRAMLLATGVSNCRMEEGSLRCDVNVSVRRAGEPIPRVRTEIKNLNSFSYTEKAIAYEIARQIEERQSGILPEPQTRRYDESTGKTVRMRRKESGADYRFLPDPDLPPVRISEEEIESLRSKLPELPAERIRRMTVQYGIPEKDAALLCREAGRADYYEKAATVTRYPETLLHLFLGEVLRECTENPFSAPIAPERLGVLSDLLGRKEISGGTAKKLLQRLRKEDFDPGEAVLREELGILREPEQIRKLVTEALSTNPRAAADYRKGKTAALQALLGGVMARSGGRADPELSERILRRMLDGNPEEKGGD